MSQDNSIPADTLRAVCDDIVMLDPSRPMIVETMYSALFDLARDHCEVLARIHPAKKKFFDLVSGGRRVPVSVRDGYRPPVTVMLHDQIHIHVNGPDGGMAILDYATVARSAVTVTGEAQGRGFDADAEPVIRQMPDRSFRLVFFAMPPSVSRLGAAFDVDHFGEALLRATGAELRWDDCDVVWIAPSAGAQEIRALLRFLSVYDGTQ